jgi:hypothetical protein
MNLEIFTTRTGTALDCCPEALLHYHRVMSIPVWLPVAISLLGTTIALSAFAYQIHRARFNQSVDLLFKLENDFFGPAKRLQRAKACRDLASGQTLEAEPILDFFETMALLLRRGALDAEMVRHTFFYWLDHYYTALESQIIARQKIDALVWKDLSKLVSTLRKDKARELHVASLPRLTPEQVAAFLTEEQTEVVV